MIRPACDELRIRGAGFGIAAERRAAGSILLATILASSLVFVDGTVVGIALPVMQRDLHATAAATQWVVQAYTLVLGALMLLGGALADRYGRKLTLLIGVLVFVVGSVWCALATNMPVAILARIVEAIGGVLLAPASLAIIGSSFAGSERDRAVAMWSAFTSAATMVSPVLGGALIDVFGWRSVFYINVPLAAVVLLTSLRHVPESRDTAQEGPLDVSGSLLETAALTCIVYALFSLSNPVTTIPLPLGLGTVGIALFGRFIALERRKPNAILPLDMFASRTFTGINVVTLFLYGAISALFYYLPFDLIQVHGYSAFLAGAASLPFIICVFLVSAASAQVVARLGVRNTLTTGAAVVAIGLVMLAIGSRGGPYWSSFFPAIMLAGIGMGLVAPPLTSAVMGSVPARHIGVASGVNSAVARIAGLLAIALAGAVLWAGFNAQIRHRLDAVHASAAQREEVLAQRADLAGARLQDPSLQRAVLQAYDAAFGGVVLMCACLAAASSVTSAIMVKR